MVRQEVRPRLAFQDASVKDSVKKGAGWDKPITLRVPRASALRSTSG